MKSQSCSGRALANGVAENALLQTVVSFVLESRPGIELKSARRLLYARKKSASFSYVFFLQNRRTRCFCVVSLSPHLASSAYRALLLVGKTVLKQ